MKIFNLHIHRSLDDLYRKPGENNRIHYFAWIKIGPWFCTAWEISKEKYLKLINNRNNK